MSLLDDLGCDDFIAKRVQDGHTCQQIALELQHLYPGCPGFSARSVRRFCSRKNIHRSSRLSTQEVNDVVEHAVAQVSSLLIS